MIKENNTRNDSDQLKHYEELNVLKIDGTIDNKHARDLEIEIQKNTRYHNMD
jgi:hypothetical protein